MTCIALIIALLPTAPATAIEVEGLVEADTGASKVALARFDQVEEGWTLTTHEQARAVLRLPSGSELRLAPSTQLTIGKLRSVPPQSDGPVTELKLLAGRLWAGVMRLAGKDQRFDVQTANAVAGVRGTAFWITSTSEGDTYVVDHGHLVVQTDAASLDLRGAGAAVTGTEAGLTRPTRLSGSKLQALRRTVQGPGGRLLHALRTRRPLELPPGRRPIDRQLLGPDDLVETPLQVEQPTELLSNVADVNVRVSVEP